MVDFASRLQHRQASFKRAEDPEEARQRREEANVQIRKQVKEAYLQRRRRMDTGASPSPSMLANQVSCEAFGLQQLSLEQLVELRSLLRSGDSEARLWATRQLRCLLCVESGMPHSRQVMDADVVPCLLDFLRQWRQGASELLIESAWVVTNIAADHAQALADLGAVQLFVELLQAPSSELREQSALALGNIAGDSAQLRDLALRSGGLTRLVAVLQLAADPGTVRNSTWALASLCGGHPAPPLEWLSPALGPLARLVQCRDAEVLANVCWALAHLSTGAVERAAAVLHAGVCSRLVQLVEHSSAQVQTAALRTLASVSACRDSLATELILRSGLLPLLLALLAHPNRAMRREACCVVSSAVKDSAEHLEAFLESGVIGRVLDQLRFGDAELRERAAAVVHRAAAAATSTQLERLIAMGAIRDLSQALNMHDLTTSLVILDALDSFLRAGKIRQDTFGINENPCATLLEQAGGLQMLEAMQQNCCSDLYQRAAGMLEIHFKSNDGMAPMTDVCSGLTKFGQELRWRVTAECGITIQEDMCFSSKVLSMKFRGESFGGTEIIGGWIRLVQEPGYAKRTNNGHTLLEEVLGTDDDAKVQFPKRFFWDQPVLVG